MSNRRVRKSNTQSRFGLAVVFLVVVIVIVACGVRSLSLNRQRKELKITESHLEMQIKNENLRTEELEEKEKYMKTKKYIEDEAKNKLGLVNKDEIVIKPKEDDD
ncbi:MAG: septum formation initiator family protein [Eubacterium sp.]|nr:septum formation initiator family protein [Eubacterium sp.]